MNETEEAKERRLVDRMASVLRFGKTREEVFEHKHCGYCKKPIRVEYNKRYCDDHCRRTDAMRSWILLALFLGACAAGWALVAIAAISEHVPA